MKATLERAVKDETISSDCSLSEKGTSDLTWYCVRTKPKHEHIATANLRSHLSLDVFNPQLRSERKTVRGLVRVTNPLFPCYLFVRCVLRDSLGDIRYTNGIGSFVHFGGRIPVVPDFVIADLRSSFGADELMACQDSFSPGVGVIFASGAFAGMNASVLRVLSAGQRVQVLLEILGRPTTVEVERSSLVLENFSMADRLPSLVALRKNAASV